MIVLKKLRFRSVGMYFLNYTQGVMKKTCQMRIAGSLTLEQKGSKISHSEFRFGGLIENLPLLKSACNFLTRSPYHRTKREETLDHPELDSFMKLKILHL
jgi:hypothetical protein